MFEVKKLEWFIKRGHPTIVANKGPYNTTDVFLYNIDDKDELNFFAMADIWGGRGAAVSGEGLYYELPPEMASAIKTLPFISRKHITVFQN